MGSRDSEMLDGGGTIPLGGEGGATEPWARNIYGMYVCIYK